MAYSEKVLDQYEHPRNVAIASSSLATEGMMGRTLEEAEAIKNSVIVQELSLPPVKIHCSVLAEDAIQAAIKDYRQKHGLVDDDGETEGMANQPSCAIEEN